VLAGPDRTLVAADLEVAVLRRTSARRAFHRIEGEALEALVPAASPADDDSSDSESTASDPLES
jgi:hypothetical protein